MGQLHSTEFWTDRWVYIISNAGAMIPLVIISMALGWWLRGRAVRSEIVGLERANEALEQHVSLAWEKDATLTPAVARLRTELAEIETQVGKLEERMPDQPEVKKLRLSVQTSTSSIGDLSAALAGMEQIVSGVKRGG
jgi:Tfp pilus assembly protein PilO